MPASGIIRPFDHQIGLMQRLMDAVLIVCVLVACYWAYHGNYVWSDKYTITAISAVALFYLAAKMCQLYQSYRLGGVIQELQPLLATWFLTLGGLLVLGYAFKITHELSRVVLGLWAIATPLLLLAWRQVIRSVLKRMRASGHNSRSVIIVGVNSTAKSLAANMINMPWMGLKLNGMISEEHSGDITVDETHQVKILGNLESLFEIAHSNQVDIVYLAVPMHEREAIDRILKKLGDTTVSIFLVPDFYTAGMMQGSWVTVGDTPTVTVIDNPNQGIDSWVKRAEDVTVASLALIVLALPMAIIAVAVKMSSPGPVIYKQRRYGINGKSIDVWKFRSMSVTESDAEFVQAKKDDARVTQFGAFIRKTSLDELPQFINVLRGEMSVVGPRPHAEAHNEEFRKKVNGYMLRHKVKPGITGLAQVNGLRGETDTTEKMERRVRFDVEYINNWSVWGDLVILVKTPFILMSGGNAY